MLLVLLLAQAAVTRAAGNRKGPGVDVWLGTTLGLLLGWTSIRLVFSPINTDAFRDAAPFFYGLLAYLVLPLDRRQTRLAGRLVMGALIFHAAWVTFALVFQSVATGAPPLAGGEARLFEIRADVDSMLAGTLAALALFRLLRTPTLGSLVPLAWGLGLVFVLPTRAGLLATGAQFILVLIVSRGATSAGVANPPLPRQRRRLVAAAVLTVLAPALVVLAWNTPAVSKLTTTATALATEDPAGNASLGTTTARVNTWDRLVPWIDEQPSRVIGGVGFGLDYLQESGAARLLVGVAPADDVRTPHNFVLNAWARLGLVGAGLLLALIAAGMRLGWLVSRKCGELTELDITAFLLVVGVPVAAAFGVVLEAPFGAIPFFWGIGHLSSRSVAAGITSTLSSTLTGNDRCD